MNVDIIQGDCLEELRKLPDQSIQCVITSPPYYGLRDYGTAKWSGGDPKCDHTPQKPDGGERADRALPLGRGGIYRDICAKCSAIRIDKQIGLEQTPDEYVEKLVDVFRDVRRVLHPTGVCFLNLGDSYDDKQLLGIPWRVAFALQADGWWLRQDIIWHKPNPMPESVKDRCTKSHEYIFLLTKSAKYYYDHEAIKEDTSINSHYGGQYAKNTKAFNKQGNYGNAGATIERPVNGRNARSVWTITTKPYKEAHFATFPPEIPERCIKAGTSEKGCCPECGAPWERVTQSTPNKPRVRKAIGKGSAYYSSISGPQQQNEHGNDLGARVETIGWRPTCEHNADPIPCTILDPFAGSGTTLMVAAQLGRSAIGIDLSAEYIELARRRIAEVQVELPL